MEKSISASSHIRNRIRSSNLAQLLFKAEVPEEAIRRIPAQSLFLAINHNGLASSFDLLMICTSEQMRLLIDFDCWSEDRFNEERLWEWLALGDEDDGLEFLLRILKSIDLKLVGLLVSKYVSVITLEEPSGNPPEYGYHTPDQGSTWLRVQIENDLHHFLLTRFLALIFETSAEVFYQILAIPTVSTPSMLEEDSFQERNTRLSELGIPDPELALEYQTPLRPHEVKALVEKKTPHSVWTRHTRQIPVVEPLLYDGGLSNQLEKLYASVDDVEAFEAELTLLMNSALVHWKVSPHDRIKFELLCEQVKGCCEVGLSFLAEYGLLDALYRSISLATPYRLGLHFLMELRREARAVDREGLIKAAAERSTLAFLAGLRETFPCVPDWFNRDVQINTGDNFPTQTPDIQPTVYRAISDRKDLDEVKSRFNEILRSSLS
jgi:Family of unknown function (DUF6178)